ncbi:DUF3016 domain-containing protein [Thalassotalea atypica]|uniref:DUF3016 domain-containing protein n=1 Tax=Thalassotalea atypica TaxID=2054316 RepID=UPI0025743A25|nr:DUF3016 domain-containing protein [Thalassotalea atypica]
MKKFTNLFYIVVLALVSNSALAASTNVSWENVDDYRDVRSANGSNKKFKAHVFKELEQHITELASDLPESYSLEVKVTNVDLAGNVQFINTQQIRVIKEIFIPRVSLSYILTDGNGKSLQADTVEIKDMTFMDNLRTTANRDSFAYEKNMLTSWFKATFS